MTTVTTIGIGGLGLAGLAAAGAAAAGAIGLAAIAGRVFGGGRRGRRRGREVQDNNVPEAEILERTLTLIRQQDITGCGLRLVCELAGLNEEELDEEQKAILSLVDMANDHRHTPGEGILPSLGATDYKAARTVGIMQGDCGTSFPMCSLNGTELMQVIGHYLP
ncbi:hypothetical protein SK128_012583 [Halocaridina rubra]|uniref:Uncharacterized protein n=1 Tax=Halocaridina rubra TaxID=373956 RepID=A0AAN8ZZE5_HALRR